MYTQRIAAMVLATLTVLGAQSGSMAHAATISTFTGDGTFVAQCNQGTSNTDCETAVGEIRGGRAGAADWEMGIQSPVGSPQQTRNWNWTSEEKVSFSFAYRSLEDDLTLIMSTASRTIQSRVSLADGALDAIDTMFIRARSQDANNRIELTDMMIDGILIPDAAYVGPGGSNAAYITIKDVDFGSDWTLAGAVTATFEDDNPPRGSRLNVNFKLATVDAAPVPLPAAGALLLGAFGLLGGARVLRRTKTS